MPKHTHLGVYVLLTQHRHLLLIRKARGPYTGMLDLPGGSIEFGESPEQTARRELLEETGLTATSLTLLDARSHTGHYADTHLHHLAILYRAHTFTGTLRTDPDGQDATAALWLPLNNIPADANLTPFAHHAVQLALATC